jgi:hypothetical protein
MGATGVWAGLNSEVAGDFIDPLNNSLRGPMAISGAILTLLIVRG